MESLLSSFDSSIKVSFDECDTFSTHPRFSQYKQKNRKCDQKARISKFLEEQKRKKENVLNQFRGIDNLDVIEEKLSSSGNQVTNEKRIYKDYLMMSEWLVEVPDDFTKDWIAVPCPIGKRVLVIAEKGTSVAYSRKGFTVLHKFPSALPGGSKLNKRCSTILDCIWSEANRTLYVLDLVHWGADLINCPCDLRFSWLSWKFNESKGEYSTESRFNRYRVALLERFPCDRLPQYVSKQFPLEETESITMDGIIFYHKEGFYMDHGRSPLVTWLKPYMLTEILGVSAHPSYEATRPSPQMETECEEGSNRNNIEMEEESPCETQSGVTPSHMGH